MDHPKIHDSQLADGEKSSFAHFLDCKLENGSMSTEENTKDFNLADKRKKIIPKYAFKIVEHSIGDSVEYQVELLESFKVFRKTIAEVYKFKTRYSKL